MKIYKFKPNREKKSLFARVLLLVGVVQVALLLALGGLIVKKVIPMQDVEMMNVPTPPKKDDFTKETVGVWARQQGGKFSPPPIPIAVQNPSAMDISEFTIDVGPGEIGGAGYGQGFVLEDPSVRLDNIEIPDIIFQGQKLKSDRVFIAFEVSEEVMRDEMGGFDAFNVIKDEIKALVESLQPAMVFNIMAFDAHHKILYQTCFPTLVPANRANKDNFMAWMNSINPDTENIGLKWNDPREYKLGNPVPPFPQISFHYDGHHKWEVVGRYGVYQAAIESKAGAVWILTRSWPDPEKYYMSIGGDAEKKYMAEWEKNVREFERGGKKVATDDEYRDWIKSTDAARKKARAWLEAENKNRESKGVPKRVITDMLALANELKIPFPEKPTTRNDLRPAVPKFKTYKKSTLFAAYEPILKANYDANELERPKVNIIMLLGRTDQRNSTAFAGLNSWAKLNNGNSRILRAGRPVSEYN